MRNAASNLAASEKKSTTREPDLLGPFLILILSLCPLLSIGTELAKRVCSRLRDPASDCGGKFTQLRTPFFGQLCTMLQSLASFVTVTNATAAPLLLSPPFRSGPLVSQTRLNWAILNE